MVYVENELRCEVCNVKGDALILINSVDKIKRCCYRCVRNDYWRYLREGGYWRKVFNKLMFNKDYTPRVGRKRQLSATRR